MVLLLTMPLLYPAIVPMEQQRQTSVATVTQQANKLIIPIE
jgi:hypothetical protein